MEAHGGGGLVAPGHGIIVILAHILDMAEHVALCILRRQVAEMET